MARTNFNRNRAFHNKTQNPDQIIWDKAFMSAMSPGPAEEELRAEAEANRKRSGVILLPNSITGDRDIFDDFEPYSREQGVDILRGWGLEDRVIVKMLRLGETSASKIKILTTIGRWIAESEPMDSIQADKLSTLAIICESLDEHFSGDAEAIKLWFAEPHIHLDKKSPMQYIESNPKDGLGQISMTLWLEKNNVKRK